MARGIVNNNLFRIVGMSRSGNHAIIDWTLAQLPGRWTFLNCIDPCSDPFATARPTDRGRCYATNDPNFDFEAERAGRLATKDHLVISQEDTFLGPALGEQATAIQDAAVGAGARQRDVIILRDPYNLFASRKRFGHQLITDRTAVRIWKQHARAFLGERKYLRRPTILISYNQWVEERSYRRSIAESFGLLFTDANVDRVAQCGGGSSFDGYSFEGQAGGMAVFDRWKSYADDPDFRKLFDSELAEFAEAIFGHLPAAAYLLPRRTTLIPGARLRTSGASYCEGSSF